MSTSPLRIMMKLIMMLLFFIYLTYQLNEFICPGSQSLINKSLFLFFLGRNVRILIFSNECYFSSRIYVTSIAFNCIFLPVTLATPWYFLQFYIFKTPKGLNWSNTFRVFFAFNKKQTKYLIEHRIRLKLALK